MSILSNSRELTETEQQELEALIDSATLSDVLEALAVVCRNKAEHIRHTWQDRVTARPWDAAAEKLERLGSKTLI